LIYFFKKRTIRVIPIVFFLTFLLPFPLSPEEPLLVKMGTLAPEGSDWLNTWKEMIPALEKNPVYPLKILTYPGGVMGDEPQMVRKLRLGQLSVIGVTINGLGQICPEILSVTIPFLFQGYEEIDHILETMFPIWNEYAKKRGYKILAVLDQGIIRFFSKERIPKPSTLTQRRVWGWAGESISLKNLELLGIVPIVLPVPEVLTSLQTGLIDTIPTRVNAVVALQWYTQLKYMYTNPWRYEPATVIISMESLKKIPPEKREPLLQALVTIAKPYIQKLQRRLREQEKNFIELLKESGYEIITWNEEDLTFLREKGKEAEKVFTGALFPEEVYNQLKKELNSFRSRKGGG